MVGVRVVRSVRAGVVVEEVVAVRRERMDRIADYVEKVNADDLNRQVPSPNGGTTSVMSCLHIVLREEWWHDQYANRDLAILERREAGERS